MVIICLAYGFAGAATRQVFEISVDQEMWKRWGFQYPVTYIFDVSGVSPDTDIKRRDDQRSSYESLRRKLSTEFFNGDECVRFDLNERRGFVSVGFKASNSIELQFDNVKAVKFAGVARYYDDRKMAYTLSLDNWGRLASAHPGAPWHGVVDDRSDNYQAALCVCRGFHLPVSIAINTGMTGGDGLWNTMQEELNRQDASWEPAVHAQTHPGSRQAYGMRGYVAEILGCRDEILRRLRLIYGKQHVFEHILTSGYVDDAILRTDAGEFLFVRGYNGHDNPASTNYASWDGQRGFYGVGGLNTKDYDRVFARRDPKGRYFTSDVAELDKAFEEVYEGGGIFYAMWHPDRYLNSVLYDARPGKDGIQGSTLVQHLNHVANRRDVWYVANGWLYCCRYVAEHVSVINR
jgi:hypothetical protein